MDTNIIVSQKESIFFKITDQIDQKNFYSVTKINGSKILGTQIECMAYCLKNEDCKFANFNNNQCVTYKSLSYHHDILNGTFWMREAKPKYVN
ncbi:hypothetical protein BpHYR1_040528 [Brachionus plicatilis]|uniref:Apple domain-containing protein n=1 Tax=Brachionus plicatilis TaxID=10195 RepID=A0A3M7RN83_BRAPC|nr:hypothetical protein BpHYR1_040528 [Brachionus plicatilis]